MIYAIESRKANAIRVLIPMADVNLTHNGEQDGLTALIVAANKGEVSVVAMLLDDKANVNARSDIYGTALIAAINPHVSDNFGVTIIKMLLKAGAEDDIEGAIRRARELNKPHILKVLEEHIKKVST